MTTDKQQAIIDAEKTIADLTDRQSQLIKRHAEIKIARGKRGALRAMAPDFAQMIEHNALVLEQAIRRLEAMKISHAA